MEMKVSSLRDVDLLQYIYLNYKCGGGGIIPHKYARIVLDKDCHIMSKSRFDIGVKRNVKTHQETCITMKRSARIICNGRMEIYTGCDIWIGENATLKLGTGYFNNGVQVVCFRSVKIGNNVIVGPNTVIRDSDAHHLGYPGHRMTKRVVIEDNVWIGCGAMILKGVTIGEGSVVSAGAVVTKDVPPHSLVGGIPAKVIRQNIKWRD